MYIFHKPLHEIKKYEYENPNILNFLKFAILKRWEIEGILKKDTYKSIVSRLK